jgi:putative transcriptional regulator
MTHNDPALVRAGTLLVAHPTLVSPPFTRSVVMVAEHSAESTVGYVLNRQLETHFKDILPETFAATGFDTPLYWGGPCEPNTIHCVHLLGDVMGDAASIHDGIFWGGDFEMLRKQMQQGVVNPHDVRFFVGYSGWDAGQLAAELEEESWIAGMISRDLVFDATQKNLWMRSLRSLGDEYIEFANSAEHPSLN